MRNTLRTVVPLAFWMISPVFVWGGLACTKTSPYADPSHAVPSAGMPDSGLPSSPAPPAGALAFGVTPPPAEGLFAVAGEQPEVRTKDFQVQSRWHIMRWHDDELLVTCYLAVTDRSVGQSIACIPDSQLNIKSEKTP